VPLLEGTHVWQLVLALAVASLGAPIVEETMFRGVLYRHLREATKGWGTALSILLGVGINATIFAAVHPQGLLAVPALASIGAGLTLAREWRGSLVAPMVAHGFHNGLMLTVVILALG
jgi:membrane protease YdiL (CAAX protease family)